MTARWRHAAPRLSLYVREITPTDGEKVPRVGRTGDSFSPNAQSLFTCLGTLVTPSIVRASGDYDTPLLGRRSSYVNTAAARGASRLEAEAANRAG